MKANEVQYISNLFDKVLYMFRTAPQSIIRSILTLYTCSSYLPFQFCWRLLADSGHVRNMKSALSNKSEKQCISLAFIIRIYHDARSSERHIHLRCKLLVSINTFILLNLYQDVYCSSQCAFRVTIFAVYSPIARGSRTTQKFTVPIYAVL